MSNNLCFAATVAFVLISSQAFGSTLKKPVEPTGEARAQQFAKQLKWCQDKYGRGQLVPVEWKSLYGQTGWWCMHH
jgi:hypothetical protein